MLYLYVGCALWVHTSCSAHMWAERATTCQKLLTMAVWAYPHSPAEGSLAHPGGSQQREGAILVSSSVFGNLAAKKIRIERRYRLWPTNQKIPPVAGSIDGAPS